MTYDLLALQKEVSERLSEKRYLHTLGVAHTSAALALRYGEDMTEAFLAGLFHDIAKPYSDKKMLEKCTKHGIYISEVEQRNPYLLHGKLGAWITEHKFRIEVPEILSAITWHTTGRAGMTNMEKIVFLADYMEPNRPEVPGLSKIRGNAFVDLDQTVYMVLRDTVEYLSSVPGKEMDAQTMEAYWFYEAAQKEKRKEEENKDGCQKDGRNCL